RRGGAGGCDRRRAQRERVRRFHDRSALQHGPADAGPARVAVERGSSDARVGTGAGPLTAPGLFPSLDGTSNVILKPLVPLYSNALLPSRYASTSFCMSTKPSLRGVFQYLRFLMTIGSSVLLCMLRLSETSAVLPPFSVACALSLSAVHSIGASFISN